VLVIAVDVAAVVAVVDGVSFRCYHYCYCFIIAIVIVVVLLVWL
jgi:hypothetical protein